MDERAIEMLALRSIYLNEIEIEENDVAKTIEVTCVLKPATCDRIEDQHVCLTLRLTLPEKYPSELPKIAVRNPRGLADEHVRILLEELKFSAKEHLGTPVVHQLIETVRESLTEYNMPHCTCAICLYEFVSSSVFIKTKCYHYFHQYCLAKYAVYVAKVMETTENNRPRSSVNLSCPICRTNIQSDWKTIDFDAPDPSPNEPPSFQASPDLVKYRQIYEKQLAQGGIIDVEENSSRFLLPSSGLSEENSQVPPLYTYLPLPQDNAITPKGNSSGKNLNAKRKQTLAVKKSSKKRSKSCRGKAQPRTTEQLLRDSFNDEDSVNSVLASNNKIKPRSKPKPNKFGFKESESLPFSANKKPRDNYDTDDSSYEEFEASINNLAL